MSLFKPVTAGLSPPRSSLSCASHLPSPILVPAVPVPSTSEFFQSRAQFFKQGSLVGTAAHPLSIGSQSFLVRPDFCGIRTFSEHAEEYPESPVQLERVPWDKTMANTVSLIGKVTWRQPNADLAPGGEPRFEFGLSVLRPQSLRGAGNEAGEEDPVGGEDVQPDKVLTDWFNVKVYGPYAVAAAQEVQAGAKVVVQGRIHLLEQPADGTQRDGAEVFSRWIAFVKTREEETEQDGDHQLPSGYGSHGQHGRATAQAGQGALWSNRGQGWAEGQARPRLSSGGGSVGRGAGRAAYQQQGGPRRPVPELWEELFRHPGDFYDNRESKPTPRHPDFKHKQTGEALWLDGSSTPAWVHQCIRNLGDEGAAAGVAPGDPDAFQEEHAEAGFSQDEHGDDHTQSGHEGAAQASQGYEGPHGSFRGRGVDGAAHQQQGGAKRSLEEVWEELFEHPGNFYDNRDTKTNPRFPDFKHKKTQEALWIDGSKNPTWVLGRLPELDGPPGTY